MKIFKGNRDYKIGDFANPVVTIGNFDGCHLGHQEIFRRTREYAKNIGGEAVVYTFDPHPAAVIRGVTPQLIFTLEEKVATIGELGMDALIVAPFDRGVAGTDPEVFVRDTILGRIGARGMVVGHDFVFGRNNGGDIGFLRTMGKKYDFLVDQVPSVMSEGVVVSSTCIRHLIQTGNVAQANRFLPRPYSITGEVVHGMKRGHRLGFPTANIRTAKALIPAYGVYAVYVHLGGVRYEGVLNIGNNPTFGDVSTCIEAFLFDFDGDIYGAGVKVEFMDYIRGEIKFPDSSYLIDQMQADAGKALDILRGREA